MEHHDPNPIPPDNRYALETQDLAIYYGAFRAVKEVNFKVIPAQDHRDHRILRLWEEHSHSIVQPNE